eukprot:1285707-Rhodomonas_salina.2
MIPRPITWKPRRVLDSKVQLKGVIGYQIPDTSIGRYLSAYCRASQAMAIDSGSRCTLAQYQHRVASA